MLAKINKHKRDNNIVFIEESHKYIINNEDGYTSATTWVHRNFEPFDNDTVIDKMMSSPYWPKSPNFGLSRDEIKQKWTDNGKESSALGCKLHHQIELFMNQDTGKVKPTHMDLLDAYLLNPFAEIQSIEWDYFIDFVKHHPHFIPYRSEWMVYQEDKKICGTVDMVYENPDGSLNIYDWKRCKNIQTYSFGKNSTHSKMSKIPDCNYYHYLLQLNIYKYIIETKYDKKVDKCALIKLHPNNKKNTYEIYILPKLGLKFDDLFN